MGKDQNKFIAMRTCNSLFGSDGIRRYRLIELVVWSNNNIITAAKGFGKKVGNGHQGLITNGMTVNIIKALEPIKIDETKGYFSVRALKNASFVIIWINRTTMLKGQMESIFKGSAVVKTRQRIMIGKFFEGTDTGLRLN